MSFVKCAGRQHGRRVELCVSVSVLALIAFAAGGNPSVAQEQQQQQQGTPETAPSTQPLRPVNVSAPRPRRQVNRPAPRGAPGRARPQPTVARPVEPTTTTPITGILPPVTSTAVGPLSPLDGNVVTESGSRLGIPARDIPATVNVVDQQMIREQGYRTTTEAMQGVPGVTAGDGPGAPGSISMRGFSGSQINTLYNGIKIGPSDMTNRIMDTYNLDRVEVLKGPASLMSGEGATGGAVNYVNKAPHTGPVVNEIFAGWDSFNGYRAGFGSGGSTGLKGLDYRFDVSRNFMNGFIDDTYT